MRPGQNKRMRGRPSNNRRGPNPLTRSYESNGPDVKIRGNAHHVAEKYLQLARDAHTSGDPVAAENYLQHAEHYFRLIASAQAAQAQAQSGAPRAPGEADSDEMDDDDDVGGPPDRFASPVERVPVAAPAPYASNNGATNGSAPVAAPQPYQERPAYDGNERPPQGERPQYNNDRNYQGRNDRNNSSRPQQDRSPRPDRNYQDRPDNRDNRSQRDSRPRDFRPYRDPNQPRETFAPAEAPAAPGLPSFITAPARTTAMPEAEGSNFPVTQHEGPAPDYSEGGAPSEPPAFDAGDGSDRASRRSRRRRSRPQFGFDAPEKETHRDQPLVSEESDSPAED
jgi:Domain of unknown function (DUF4167)